MEQESQQVQEIRVGDRVRSFDFPDHYRDTEGVMAVYVEGVVEEIREFPEYMMEAPRYRVRVERRVVAGREVQLQPRHEVFPPVNGTPQLFGGVCNGVELVEYCQGCEEGATADPERKTQHYTVTFRHQERGRVTQRVRYCAECVELARMNYSGDVVAVHDMEPAR